MKTEPLIAPLKADNRIIPASLAEVAEHPFLRGLSTRHLEVLADFAMQSRFEAAERIFREGDPANRFYLIHQGKVVLEADRGENEAVAIQTIGAGEVLGWSWLFPPYYWHFDAWAVEPTKAIFFYGTRLRDLCEEDHEFGYELMKRTASVVINRLMAARRQVAKIGCAIDRRTDLLCERPNKGPSQ